MIKFYCCFNFSFLIFEKKKLLFKFNGKLFVLVLRAPIFHKATFENLQS